MRTRVMDAWRSFPQEDPNLPPQFLPPDWPRCEAHTLCMDIYDTLRPTAEQRFNELISENEELSHRRKMAAQKMLYIGKEATNGVVIEIERDC